MMPGGGHQLMLFDQIVYSRVIDSWIRERVLGKAQSWDAPLEPEERSYFEFLGRERANDAAGEPEYRYSMIDRVLTGSATARSSAGCVTSPTPTSANSGASLHNWSAKSTTLHGISYATTYHR